MCTYIFKSCSITNIPSLSFFQATSHQQRGASSEAKPSFQRSSASQYRPSPPTGSIAIPEQHQRTPTSSACLQAAQLTQHTQICSFTSETQSSQEASPPQPFTLTTGENSVYSCSFGLIKNHCGSQSRSQSHQMKCCLKHLF